MLPILLLLLACGETDDGDGWTADEDCDDEDAAVNPAATEVCDNGKDDDCDGAAAGCDWPVELTTDAATTVLYGTERFDQVGYLLAPVGDTDGDGHDDLWVGAPYNRDCAGGLFLGPVSGALTVPEGDATLVAALDASPRGAAKTRARSIGVEMRAPR